MSELSRLAGEGHAEALARRGEIPALAFALRRAAPPAPASLPAYRDSLLGASASLTLLAGSASRWRASLEAARAAGRLSGPALGFDPERPRGLFPVGNLLGRGPAALPIAAYALDAVRNLGSQVLVVRGWEREIEAEILGPLGLRPGSYRFATQEAPYGKPLGHGDAAWQSRELWRDADYLVANFGGDANSRFTVEAGLLALDALRQAGEELDFLLPAALFPNPAYPIGLDPAGRPSSFGHAKLQGLGVAGRARPGYANVGIRIYRASALAALLEELHEAYWVEGRGYAVPGNDPAGAELALDNADSIFAERGRARLLAFANPEELSPVKSLEDIPGFETALSRVLAKDSLLPPLRA